MGSRGQKVKIARKSHITAKRPPSIAELEELHAKLNKKMSTVFRSAVADHGSMNQNERQTWNRLRNRANSVWKRTQRMKYKRDKEAIKNYKPEPHTFVNGFGEATHRYVTNTTYEKARKRLERQAAGVVTGYRGK